MPRVNYSVDSSDDAEERGFSVPQSFEYNFRDEIADGPAQHLANEVNDDGRSSISSSDTELGSALGVQERRKKYNEPGQQCLFDILTEDGANERIIARGITSPINDHNLVKILAGVNPEGATLKPGDRVSRLIDGYVRGDLTAIAPLAGAEVRSPQDAAALLAAYRSPFVERSTWLLIRGNEVIRNGMWAIGGIDYAQLPDSNEIDLLIGAIGARSGDRMVWSHNHPSGDVTPSRVDQISYKKMADHLRGHNIGFDGLVLNGGKFSHGVGSGNEVVDEAYDGGLRFFNAEPGAKIKDPDLVASYVKGLSISPKSVMLIHTTSHIDITAIEVFHAQPSSEQIRESREASAGAYSIVVGLGVGLRPSEINDHRVFDVIEVYDGGVYVSCRRQGNYRPALQNHPDILLNKVV